MPTRREPVEHPAAAAAEAEALRWLDVAEGVPAQWDDVAPTEAAVVGFHDPGTDLERRCDRWSHRLPDHGLASLALFAAGLAHVEANAWRRDDLHIATRAYEDRRFLSGDRILHWAVPWLDAAGRCYPDRRTECHEARDVLLDLGDRLRAAPDLGVDDGRATIGEDAYGPVETRIDAPYLRSLWSGTVLLDATLRSMNPDDEPVLRDDANGYRDLVALYESAAARWHGIGAEHPGSALLWRALSSRAGSTARLLESTVVGPSGD
jgi:hypothetical protein